jgi:DNA-binding transcriptional MocR family regulator
MPHAPFKGRWTPVPDDAGVSLLKEGKHAAFIVWIAMLRDATQAHSWSTSRPISALMKDTALSKNTIRKAQRQLREAGYMEVTNGTNGTRLTHTLTPIDNYGKQTLSDKKDSKPVGAWVL